MHCLSCLPLPLEVLVHVSAGIECLNFWLTDDQATNRLPSGFVSMIRMFLDTSLNNLHHLLCVA